MKVIHSVSKGAVVLVAAWVMATPAVWAADVITMQNGDRLTGDVVSKDGVPRGGPVALDYWAGQVRDGETPEFGPHMVY